MLKLKLKEYDEAIETISQNLANFNYAVSKK